MDESLSSAGKSDALNSGDARRSSRPVDVVAEVETEGKAEIEGRKGDTGSTGGRDGEGDGGPGVLLRPSVDFLRRRDTSHVVDSLPAASTSVTHFHSNSISSGR